MSSSSQTAPTITRQVNMATAMSAFWSGKTMTTNDVMDVTDLTRVTAHAVCDDLIARGWILEARDNGQRTRGRPSRNFQLNREAGYVLGIDLAGEHMSVVIADLAGESHYSHGFDLSDFSVRRRQRTLPRVLAESLESAHISSDQILAAGVGLSAPVSRDATVIGRDNERVDRLWSGIRRDARTVRNALEGVPVLLANDASLAVLGERWRGVAHGVDDIIVLLAAEGLGAGVMENGRILHGASGGAGEMRWLDLVDSVMGPDGVSKTARMWAREAVRSGATSDLLDSTAGDVDSITGEMVFEAAAQGDAVAVAVVDRLAASMAQVIWMTSTLLDPSMIVIAGADGGAESLLPTRVGAGLARLPGTPPRVVWSSLGKMVVAIGAVRFALNHVQTNFLDIRLANHS